jgi:anti-sigma regulatory factor (Ser/Thr protein kinase)
MTPPAIALVVDEGLATLIQRCRESVAGDVAMRDLSLHILDLIENSIRAGASVILLTITENLDEDKLHVVVEDDGSGFRVSSSEATDPFYTTKKGKRTGLGLSLLRAAAEQAGGELTVYRSRFGGAAVKATMRLSHVDRSPLGDLAATLSSLACTNPDIDLWCRLRVGDEESVVRFSEIAQELPLGECRGLAVARRVCERINTALASLEVRV